MNELDTLLNVPFIIRVTTVMNEAGQWVRRAECPELPGCVVEEEWAGEAIEALDQRRVAYLRDLWVRGCPVEIPRVALAWDVDTTGVLSG